MDLLEVCTEFIFFSAEEIAEKIRDKYVKNPSPRLAKWYKKQPKAICSVLHFLITSLGKIIAVLVFLILFLLLIAIACVFVLLVTLLVEWVAHMF